MVSRIRYRSMKGIELNRAWPSSALTGMTLMVMFLAVALAARPRWVVFGAFLGIWLRRLDSDVFSQIGLIMLIGLVAKNAILIVEFAVLEQKGGKSVVDAALAGAKTRLRPILMTSFAFILGCVPLWIASGSGAVSRQSIGTTVIAGMLAATGIAIFLVPVLYVLVARLAGGGERGPAAASSGDAPAPPGGEP
jgi:multidrug efflux pump subunit AcrB